MSTPRQKLNRALRCLYLEAPGAVVDDVTNIVHAAIVDAEKLAVAEAQADLAALKARVAELEAALRPFAEPRWPPGVTDSEIRAARRALGDGS